jgi:hypothetical protein
MIRPVTRYREHTRASTSLITPASAHRYELVLKDSPLRRPETSCQAGLASKPFFLSRLLTVSVGLAPCSSQV